MITVITLSLLLGGLLFFAIYRQRDHFSLVNPCRPCGHIGGESCPSVDEEGKTIWSACACMTPDGYAGNTCDGVTCSSSITMCRDQPPFTNPHISLPMRDIMSSL